MQRTAQSVVNSSVKFPDLYRRVRAAAFAPRNVTLNDIWDKEHPSLSAPKIHPIDLGLQDVNVLKRSGFKPQWTRPDVRDITPQEHIGKVYDKVINTETKSLGLLFHYIQCMRKTLQIANDKPIKLDLMPSSKISQPPIPALIRSQRQLQTYLFKLRK